MSVQLKHTSEVSLTGSSQSTQHLVINFCSATKIQTYSVCLEIFASFTCVIYFFSFYDILFVFKLILIYFNLKFYSLLNGKLVKGYNL